MTDDNRAKLFELIQDVQIAMLTTIEPDGSLHTRPMHNQDADPDGTIWFFLEKHGSAATNVAANPNVSLGYAHPGKNSYVALSGTASVTTDRVLVDAKWTESLKTWFPQGKDDPNVALLKVHPVHGEFWDTTSSTLLHSVGYVKAILTGTQPREMVDNEKVAL